MQQSDVQQFVQYINPTFNLLHSELFCIIFKN